MALSPASLDSYLQDASGYHGEAAQAFLPNDLIEVRDLVRTCSSQQIPLTVAGAGTGLTGARVPHGGYVISLARFRRLEIEPGRAYCGAGLSLRELHKAAAQTHQFFGPNPTEDSASIGGIFSTNAGGARSFKYRSVRHHALSIEVTFMDGETRRFKRGEPVPFSFEPVHHPETTKNSAGYPLQPGLEWIDLLAGSEGTLGLVTEIEFQLLPEPPSILGGVIFFPSDGNAQLALEAWRPLPELRLIEYLDKRSLDILRPVYAEIPGGAISALMIEQNLFSGEDQAVDEWAERLSAHDAFQNSWFGFRPLDHERFRDFRHALATIVTDKARRNGFPKFSTDFAVPVGRHLDLHAYYKERCEEVMPGKYTIFGHAGDANNHVNLLPESPAEARRGEELMREFAGAVLDMRGTVAAEHGIGKSKTDLLGMMYSSQEIASMREVKQQLDPGWLLGRGSLFPVSMLTEG